MGFRDVDSGQLWSGTGPGVRARPAVLPAAAAAPESGNRARRRRNQTPTSPGRPVTGRGKGPNYAWRPGFWGAVQPNWIWMPAHYVWTPSGYLFVGGYWDLPVANRGLMFAPVYYPAAGLHPAQLCLHAVDQHRRLGRDRQPVRLSGDQPVPLRRLLRAELRQRGDHSLVFLQFRAPAGRCFTTRCFRTTR